MKHLFFGGIHPKYNKEMSTIITAFSTIAPKQVVIPMQQHIGAPCQPLVKVGDRVLRDQKIGDGEGLCVPVHASISGTVVAVEPRPHTSGRDVMAVVIENDYEDTPCDDLAPLTEEELKDPEAILARMREAGVVGMGGATFPTHIKLPKGDATPGYSDLCALDGGKAVGLLHCHEGEVLFTRIPLQALTDA